MTPAIQGTSFREAWPRVSWLGKVSLFLLALGVIALILRLWPWWRQSPDLSHGIFMPIIFLVLLYEGRAAPGRYLAAGSVNRLGLVTLLVGAFLALVAAGMYAASLDWSHALVNLMLTLSVVLFLGAALTVFARDSVRLTSLNWTMLVAIGLWLLTAPIPPGTYTRLTLQLQLWVTEGVLRTLHVFGVPAVREGNIIDLANTRVGVEEACSGIRSLISCVFAAVFFSATLVRRGWARAVILVLAAPLALVMNFLRSLILTLLANRGVEIAGTWHDVTGFAVLGVTAAMLGGLALALERVAGRSEKRPLAVPIEAARPARAAQGALAVGVGVAALLVGFFVKNTRSSVDLATAHVPDLFALLPEQLPGWSVRTTDLYSFSGTLQTKNLAQRTYTRETENGPVEIVIYVAYWLPGQVPVSLVASHTPDACWPGSGWEAVPTGHDREQLSTTNRVLPMAEHRLFKADDRPYHVWFWHLYDGRPIAYRDPYSPVELLRIAWRYGFRRGGDQLFVRVSSNRPWGDIAEETICAEFFARTRALGL